MTRLHVSAATGHHQANTERTIGLAKFALNGIPFIYSKTIKYSDFLKIQ